MLKRESQSVDHALIGADSDYIEHITSISTLSSLVTRCRGLWTGLEEHFEMKQEEVLPDNEKRVGGDERWSGLP